MPLKLGAHADRVQTVRALLRAKDRREQSAYAFEGATLLDEAHRSGVAIQAIYATQRAYDASSLIRDFEAVGTDVYVVDDRVAAKISDLETPTGIVAITSLRLEPLDALLRDPGLTLVLADLNDPANVGTLLRSAEAFGASGVVFGRNGVDPYHPKVVRGAMGAIFRLRLCVAEADEFRSAAASHGTTVYGLAADGEPLEAAAFAPHSAIVVGHERRGLAAWQDACNHRLAIEMTGPTESLNAAVAGSIALYRARRAG